MHLSGRPALPAEIRSLKSPSFKTEPPPGSLRRTESCVIQMGLTLSLSRQDRARANPFFGLIVQDQVAPISRELTCDQDRSREIQMRRSCRAVATRLAPSPERSAGRKLDTSKVDAVVVRLAASSPSVTVPI